MASKFKISKRKLGGITGALLASTLYSGTAASADTTAETTTVQSPSADTETQNNGSLTITTEADSAKPTQQTSAAAQSASPAVSASDSKVSDSLLSASATTAKPTDNGQTVGQSITDSKQQANDNNSNNPDASASSLTDSPSAITVNVADLLNGSSAATSSADTSLTSDDSQTRTATLQYYDIINDKVVAEKVIEGTYGSVTDLDFPIPEGYTFAVDDSDLQMPKKWHFKFYNQQTTYQVPVYRKEDLSRTITRTINVHKPTGTETIKQPVTYVSKVSNVERSMLSRDFMMVPFSLPLQNKTKNFSTWYAIDGSSANLNSYDVTVSAAQPDGTTEWAEYVAPEIEGYTVSQPVVSKVSVKPTDSDVTVDIYYTPEKTEPETPTEPQSEEPKVDDPKPEEPQAEEPVTPATPETPKEEQPAKVESPASPEPEQPEESEKPETGTPEVSEQPAVIESNAEPAAAPVSTEPVQPTAASNTADTQPVQLPQTGDERSNTMGIAGAVSAMIGTLLAFAGKKKRQN